MRKRKYDQITSTLCDDLHWLPICQRIVYKLSSIVYKCLHGAAPSYLINLCVPVATNTSCHYLHSTTHADLLVPRTRMVTYGPRSFAVSGPFLLTYLSCSCLWGLAKTYAMITFSCLLFEILQSSNTQS